MDILIIGGGASGMMAALSASQIPDNRVLLLERQGKVGRKLLATGNGRCNLTNKNCMLRHYHGDAPQLAIPALDAFGVQDTLDFFARLGLLTVSEPSGRVYPYSDQSNSVLDVLRFALERPNITLHCGCEVTKIKRTPDGFAVTAGEERFSCQRLIVACGGIAGSKLGGSMSGYQLLRSLGHRCSRLRPALVQLLSSYPRCPSLKGIRANCRAELLRDETCVAASAGEVQFTQTGLSGPVIYEISRDACTAPGAWSCRLDLLPQFSEAALLARLEARQAAAPALPAEELFTGTLHNRLGRILTQEAELPGQSPLASLTREQLSRAAQAAKAFSFRLTGPMGMDAAQVTAGGILLSEFDPGTLESRLVPGLFACGEVLDIDGDCGGYNLQWAWSSGRLAGLSAGRKP